MFHPRFGSCFPQSCQLRFKVLQIAVTSLANFPTHLYQLEVSMEYKWQKLMCQIQVLQLQWPIRCWFLEVRSSQTKTLEPCFMLEHVQTNWYMIKINWKLRQCWKTNQSERDCPWFVSEGLLGIGLPFWLSATFVVLLQVPNKKTPLIQLVVFWAQLLWVPSLSPDGQESCEPHLLEGPNCSCLPKKPKKG